MAFPNVVLSFGMDKGQSLGLASLRVDGTGPGNPLHGVVDAACIVTVTRKALVISASGVPPGQRWSVTLDWERIRSLEVEARGDTTVLTVDNFQATIPAQTVETVSAAIGPYRQRINTARRVTIDDIRASLANEPEPAEVTFNAREGGIEINFSDRVAHELSAAVDEFSDWVATVSGVDHAFREDREVVIALGSFSHRNLKRDARHWWRQRDSTIRLT
jgi:hypothetical protein